jgi:thiamine-phosphate pyrophosphorylase
MTPRLMVITDLAVADEEQTCRALEGALSAVPASTMVIGLRDHDANVARRVAFGHRLAEIVHGRGARLVVHDRVDVARVIGADGVHLAARSIDAVDARRLLGRPCSLSRSCHDARALAAADDEGLDFVTLSPLFASPGKGAPLGPARFGELRRAHPSLHVLALGGIDETNVIEAKRAGADGVAVIRALLGAKDPGATARALIAPFVD